MNHLNRNNVILAAVILAGLMCLYPPWTTFVPFNSVTVNADVGYGFLFSPPNALAEVNFGRLFIQLIVVGCVAFILIRVIENRKTRSIS